MFPTVRGGDRDWATLQNGFGGEHPYYKCNEGHCSERSPTRQSNQQASSSVAHPSEGARNRDGLRHG